VHKKYIALFPKEDNELAHAQRQEMMTKILKTIEKKNEIRDKELREMDMDSDMDDEDN